MLRGHPGSGGPQIPFAWSLLDPSFCRLGLSQTWLQFYFLLLILFHTSSSKESCQINSNLGNLGCTLMSEFHSHVLPPAQSRLVQRPKFPRQKGCCVAGWGPAGLQGHGFINNQWNLWDLVSLSSIHSWHLVTHNYAQFAQMSIQRRRSFIRSQQTRRPGKTLRGTCLKLVSFPNKTMMENPIR